MFLPALALIVVRSIRRIPAGLLKRTCVTKRGGSFGTFYHQKQTLNKNAFQSKA